MKNIKNVKEILENVEGGVKDLGKPLEKEVKAPEKPFSDLSQELEKNSFSKVVKTGK